MPMVSATGGESTGAHGARTQSRGAADRRSVQTGSVPLPEQSSRHQAAARSGCGAYQRTPPRADSSSERPPTRARARHHHGPCAASGEAEARRTSTGSVAAPPRGWRRSFAVANAVSRRGASARSSLWVHGLREGRASIGYWVGPEPPRAAARATHALRAVSTWGFSLPGIERLELYVEPWNEPSWRTAERAGYLREGLMRSWEPVGGERRDMYMYSLLRLRPARRRVGRMRIATWNVNSVRSRIDRVEAFLQRHEIDVLALQETKARDDQWPTMGLEALGYDVATLGHNQWNGVAIVSRVGLEDVEHGFAGMPGYGDPAGRRGAGDRRDVRRGPGVVALRAQRPRDRRPAPGLQARLARGAARRPRPAGSPTTRSGRSRSPGTGTSHRATRTSSTSRSSRRARTSRRRSGRRSRRSWTPATRTSCGRTTRDRRSTPTGTTTGSASSGTAGCASTSCSAPLRFAARVTGARDRPRRAGRQGRQRPRPGDRRPGGLSGQRRRASWSRTEASSRHLGRDELGRPGAARPAGPRRGAAGRPRASTGGRRTPAGTRSPPGPARGSRTSVEQPRPLDVRGPPARPGRLPLRPERRSRRRRSASAALTACLETGSAIRSWLPKIASTPPGSSRSAAWVHRVDGSVQCQAAAA